ncbi:MAG: serine/threonine protein kinase, partial [Acidimicrobiales bacterium]
MALSRLTDRVGQVLSDRYRLLAPIGTGASASVYLADDVTLRRRVAVKILHDALSGDEAFLRRFRAEAQAAAALNHPHIMSVFDW